MGRVGRWAGWAVASLVVGCSGKAIIDAEPSTTAATTTSSTTSSTTGSTTGSTTATGVGGAGDPCSALFADLEAKLAAAQACDPSVNMVQCSGDTVLTDPCGCEVVGNDGLPDEAARARAAYDSWTAARCGPYDCTACPPPPESPWFCHPDYRKCWPAYE